MWEIIASDGISAVTLRSIAARGGISMGRVQHYFPTRESIVEHALTSLIAIAADTHPVPDDPQDALRMLLTHAIPRTDAERLGAKVWYAYLAEAITDPAIGMIVGDALRGTEDLAADLLGGDRARARVLLAAADGFAYRSLIGHTTPEAAEAAVFTLLQHRATTVLLAPDKFKGSLTAAQVADALAAGIADVAPHWTCVRTPIADGGDGTVDAAVAAGWQRVEVDTTGPTGLPVTTSYARGGPTVVIELASAVGLELLPDGVPDPLGATTFGLGTVIRHALEHGARYVVIGLGGSASTDGGAGMLQALGAVITDDAGVAIGPGGSALNNAATVDVSGLLPAAREARFTLACDVDNPLLGANGAAAVYGPQKGATAAQVTLLDGALHTWADLLTAATGQDLRDAPGAGAAGGTAFGAMTVLGAAARSGVDIVLELADFGRKVAAADLVITGEGSLDEQTLRGKAPAGIAAAARTAGVPVIAIAGRILLDEKQLHDAGFSRAISLSDLERDPARSMTHAAELLRRVGRSIASDHDRLDT